MQIGSMVHPEVEGFQAPLRAANSSTTYNFSSNHNKESGPGSVSAMLSNLDGLPCLRAAMSRRAVRDSGQQMERNPWFWRHNKNILENLRFVRKHGKHLLANGIDLLAHIKWLHSLFSIAFTIVASVTPEVPITLAHLSPKSQGTKIFWRAYGIGFLLCMVVTMLFTMVAGTWSGYDKSITYLSNDYADIIDYIFVCPCYIGLNFWMIHLWMLRQRSITDLAINIKHANKISHRHGRKKRVLVSDAKWIYSLPRLPHFYWFSIASLLFTFLMTRNYIRQVCRAMDPGHSFWFMSSPVAGVSRLNGVGIYYAILNFFLLYVVVLGFLSFISLFIETIRVGVNLDELQHPASFTITDIKIKLEPFIEGYMVAKLLCVIFIINIYSWQLSPLQKNSNLPIAIGFILVMALFFISFPRYYVETKWHKYCDRIGKCGDDGEIASIRGSREAEVAHYADNLIIATFVAEEFLHFRDAILEFLVEPHTIRFLGFTHAFNAIVSKDIYLKVLDWLELMKKLLPH